jgi:hypothetical protein
MIITERNWRSHAQCFREVAAGRADPRWWDSRMDVREGDPVESEEERTARHARARAVCRRCPLQVKRFCLADARPGVDEGVRVEMVLTELDAGRPGNRRAS